MTNAQFYTAIAVPSVLVIISWVLVVMAWLQQDKRLARLETQMDTLGNKMESGFQRVNEHLQQFYHVTGKLEGRIDTIERR